MKRYVKCVQGSCKKEIYKVQCSTRHGETYYWTLMKSTTKCWKMVTPLIMTWSMYENEFVMLCKTLLTSKVIPNSIVFYHLHELRFACPCLIRNTSMVLLTFMFVSCSYCSCWHFLKNVYLFFYVFKIVPINVIIVFQV